MFKKFHFRLEKLLKPTLLIGKRLMLIVAEIAEAYSEPCQTSKMNLFAKIINGYKGEFKTLSNI